jgi:uncharacterized membrane protein
MQLDDFLNKVDHERIVEAIRSAEARSRGEIRVHVSHRAVEDAQVAAAREFEKLGMTSTKERNGVLLYVAPRVRRFAVIGDIGIHDKGGRELWPKVATTLEAAFREGRYTEGLVEAVAKLGELLAQHFPRTSGADVNELPDQISEDR